MKKFIVNSSLLIVHCFLLLSIINYLLPIAYAADSTPSADIKAKLEELKKEIASKAAKLKQEVDRKLKDKAYVGKVKTTSESSLTLAAITGPRIVSINQDTVFESNIKSKKRFSAKTMAEEDYIAALGDSDETGVLLAKKIILLPTPSFGPKTFLWGQIVSISEKLVTLKTKDSKNISVSLPLASKVKLNDFVILIGQLDKNEIFKSKFVYTIPQGGILKPKKVVNPEQSRGVTSSAQASPSATPKVKKSQVK